MKLQSDRGNGPATFLGLALAGTFVQLALVAELFADYANSAFA